ncbi:hypothetical protein GCM10023307_13270 [Lysobacter hankyongensis]|uniref:Uncharacterized protein n=1 Tax=Lysobacter hankyongensis TaxID=1176535 RepID=A0ABP9B260_9GAMM
MHLEELARDVVQRLAIVADESEMGDGGGQHPAADELEREMGGHGDVLEWSVVRPIPAGRLY